MSPSNAYTRGAENGSEISVCSVLSTISKMLHKPVNDAREVKYFVMVSL
jgi:hypothetical protein